MKALTLHQPWASLVALGEKRVETRSWQTSYRGALAIHAAATMTTAEEIHCHYGPIFEALRRHDVWPKDLPLGAVLCITSIEGIGHTEVEEGQLSEPELSFGNYAPGRFAWHLGPVTRFKVPVYARGRQGIWNWEPLEGGNLTADHIRALQRLA